MPARKRTNTTKTALEAIENLSGLASPVRPVEGMDPDKIISGLDALSLREGLSLRAYAAKLREIADALLERANMADEEASD